MVLQRPGVRLKLDSFSFRIDAELKRAFLAVAEAQDRPAGQILRDYMRRHVIDFHASLARANDEPTALAVSGLVRDR